MWAQMVSDTKRTANKLQISKTIFYVLFLNQLVIIYLECFTYPYIYHYLLFENVQLFAAGSHFVLRMQQ